MKERQRRFLFIVSALMGLAADIATPIFNWFFEGMGFLWKHGVSAAQSGGELFQTTGERFSQWLDAQLTQPVTEGF